MENRFISFRGIRNVKPSHSYFSKFIIGCVACIFFLITSKTSVAQTFESGECFYQVKLKGDDYFIGQVSEQTNEKLTLNTLFAGKVEIVKKNIREFSCLDTTFDVAVILKDQSRFTGRFVGLDAQYVYLESSYRPENKLAMATISSMKFVRNMEGNFAAVNNPNATRYFFAPSAIPIEKGQGYYQNAYLLVNSANFGITKNVSLGGGIVIPFLFYITPKVSFKVAPKVHTGVGVLYTTTFIPDLDLGAGIPYGLVTYGSGERNVTIGSGYGLLWSDGEMLHTNYPIVTINGMYRVSKKIQLVTENWVIPYRQKLYEDQIVGYDPWGNPEYREVLIGERDNAYAAIAAGARFVFSEKSSVDFAPVLIFAEDSYVVLPYLDFVYRF